MQTIVHVKVMLAKRKMILKVLAEEVGISATELSLLKTVRERVLVQYAGRYMRCHRLSDRYYSVVSE